MSLAENVETLPQPRGGNYEFARFNGTPTRGAFATHRAALGGWRALSGASGGCDWARMPLIIAPSCALPIPIKTQQRRR